MIEEKLRLDFARDVVLLQYVGIKPVIVHGGGPQISRMLEELNIPTHFVDGHRFTDQASMDVVEMVLAGKINKEIVALINGQGGRAVGISGKDGGLARARLHQLRRRGKDGVEEEVSLGQVGTLDAGEINPALLTALESNSYVPVVAPIATGDDGVSLNINADTMAGAVASALRAEKLILLTDTPGVLIDGQTITGLSQEDVERHKADGAISGGMLPKVDCCVSALRHGVRRAHIVDGRVPHALLLEIFTNEGVGTLISNEFDRKRASATGKTGQEAGNQND
ncbi:MAG: acetylglutamate kinase [Spirochaetales bacterium]|nr:acetylglutamate kinase [Leptospiraceae bacterium]MCP5481683.1 acetylglutamate kinase [Spirochaetales bacterium]